MTNNMEDNYEVSNNHVHGVVSLVNIHILVFPECVICTFSHREIYLPTMLFYMVEGEIHLP